MADDQLKQIALAIGEQLRRLHDAIQARVPIPQPYNEPTMQELRAIAESAISFQGQKAPLSPGQQFIVGLLEDAQKQVALSSSMNIADASGPGPIPKNKKSSLQVS